jgi:hypothetical protein
MLGELAREVRFVARPIPKRRQEAVRREFGSSAAKEHCRRGAALTFDLCFAFMVAGELTTQLRSSRRSPRVASLARRPNAQDGIRKGLRALTLECRWRAKPAAAPVAEAPLNKINYLSKAKCSKLDVPVPPVLARPEQRLGLTGKADSTNHRPRLCGQGLADRSKPDQANPNKNAWICLVSFVRFGAFQWVTAIPNEKILLDKLILALPVGRGVVR